MKKPSSFNNIISEETSANGALMKTNKISIDEQKKAFAPTKKPEVIERQKLDVRYHVEDYDTNDRPRRFLEAFAAILKHSNYRFALDHFIRMRAKCTADQFTIVVWLIFTIRVFL